MADQEAVDVLLIDCILRYKFHRYVARQTFACMLVAFN